MGASAIWRARFATRICVMRMAPASTIPAKVTLEAPPTTSQNRDDEVYSCLRSLAGSEYAQVTVGWDNMWVACSSFRELEKSGVNGRAFGCLGDFRRLASDLAWEVPSGLVVVNLAKEKTLVFKDGQEPTAPGAYSALSYLRRCAALGLMVYGDGKLAFLENHWGPGRIRTSYRRLIRETVAGWGD